MAELNIEAVIKSGVEKALNKPIVDGKSITEWAAIGMKTPRWISVKDRLPEPEEKVLIWTKTECMRYAQYHDDGSKNPWYVYEDGSRAWTNVITHWMPLPEPPKEEEHGNVD